MNHTKEIRKDNTIKIPVRVKTDPGLNKGDNPVGVSVGDGYCDNNIRKLGQVLQSSQSSSMQEITLKSSGFSKEDVLLQKNICVRSISTVCNIVRENFMKSKKHDLPQKAYSALCDGSMYIIV